MGSEVEKWKQQERGEISITNKSELQFFFKTAASVSMKKNPKPAKVSTTMPDHLPHNS
jgi:hypothetical protein